LEKNGEKEKRKGTHESEVLSVLGKALVDVVLHVARKRGREDASKSQRPSSNERREDEENSLDEGRIGSVHDGNASRGDL